MNIRTIYFSISSLMLAGSLWAQPAETAKQQYVAVTSVFRADPTARGPQEFGITREDFALIKATVPVATKAVIHRAMISDVRLGENASPVVLIGCDERFAKLAALPKKTGRFLLAKEVQQAENVCVIGQSLVKRLFGDEDPIGQNIHIDKYYFLVVGVVGVPGTSFDSFVDAYRRIDPRRKRQTKFTDNLEVYVPLRTMKSRFGDVSVRRGSGTFEGRSFELSEVWIPDVDANQQIAIERLMERRHREAGDVRVRTLQGGKTTNE